MNETQLNALTEFALAHGKEWKKHLETLWLSGKDSGALRQIRNNYMPLVMSKQFKIAGV
jgi:hypothetical protein